MDYQVSRGTASGRTLASIRTSVRSVPFGPQIQQTLTHVYACLHEQADVERGLNIVAYLAPEFGVGTPVEIGVEIGPGFERCAEVTTFELPDGPVARTVHRGPYTVLNRAHHAVRAWIDRAGARMAGPHWEIYGHWTEDESALETEVVYLLHH